MLIKTLIHKSLVMLPFHQHATTPEDAQEELLIFFGQYLKERISNFWKASQSYQLIRLIFLQKVGELILRKLKD